jgi:molybdenum cofactor cytidylyltransferase
MREVAAIILAAGEARRFGPGPEETKLVAEFAGKPLVRHVADAALASQVQPIFVVTGHAHVKVLAALEGLGLLRIHNPDHAAGMSGSLKIGIGALPSSVRGAVVLLGDMPRISAGLIDRLVEAFSTPLAEPLAVVPVRAGRRGNPVLLGRGLFAQISRLHGDQGARDIVAAPGAYLLECRVEDIGIEIDIDTQEDLRRLQQRR